MKVIFFLFFHDIIIIVINITMEMNNKQMFIYLYQPHEKGVSK